MTHHVFLYINDRTLDVGPDLKPAPIKPQVKHAGVAYFNPEGKVLLGDRSDNKGWSFPSGTIEQGESPDEAARREFYEETGHQLPGTGGLLSMTEGPYSLLGFRGDSFEPRLDHEHRSFGWFDPDELPYPLHLGVRGQLRRMMSATRDAELADDYNDFFERLVKSMPTRDDGEKFDETQGHWITIHGAHVFINKHGEILKGPEGMVGKHTSELGPKPQQAQAKVAKHAIHELMASGHPFHLDELASITGHANKTSIKAWLGMFKKGEGGKGLHIEKVGNDLYQVVKGDKPAPAINPDLLKELGLTAPAPKTAQETPKAPEPSTPPAEPPIVAPSPVPAPSPAAPADGSAPKYSKEAADKDYNKTLSDLHSEIGNEAAAISQAVPLDDDEWADLALKWKQGKLDAMAQWKQDTSGQVHKAKKLTKADVFPEDVKLIKALKEAAEGGDSEALMEEAYQQWKKDTLEAKTKPKTPAVELAPGIDPESPLGKTIASEAKAKTEAEATAAKQVDLPKQGHTLESPGSNYVPEHHVGISKDDFSSKPGQSEPQFVKQLSVAHKALHASASKNAVENKKSVEAGLVKRLAKSEAFQNIKAQVKSKTGFGLEARLISAWAASSGDHRPESIASQIACAEVFGMKDDDLEWKAMESYKGGKTNDQVYKAAAETLGIKATTTQELETFKTGIRDFILAQYHETQDHLKSLGISELYLVRGMTTGSSSTGPSLGKLKLQPASSFTTAHGTAHGFAGGHSLYAVKVPASQVLSSFVTGYGCTSESEVVVLSHPGMHAFKVGTSHASSITAMAQSIAKSSGAAPASTAFSTSASSVVHASFKNPPEPSQLVPDIGAFDSKWKTKAQEALKSEGLAGLKKATEEMEEYKASFGMKMPNATKYYKALADWAEKQAPAGSGLPAPSGASANKNKQMYIENAPMNKQYKAKLSAAFQAGDLAAVKALYAQTKNNKNLPKTKAVIYDVLQYMEGQQKAAAQAPATQTATQVAKQAEQVKKNAHYYKKIKAAVLSHPEHTQEYYNDLKFKGFSNEQILAIYKKAQQDDNKY